MMYMIDWITCCCYMMLRKFHYADWDAESSAIVNSGVVVGIWLIIISNLFLLSFSPDSLQRIYDYGKIYYVGAFAIAICGVSLRYYYLRKDAIPLMEAVFKSKGWDKGWLLFVVSAVILVGSIVIGFFVAQYVKSQGIVFG